MKSIGKWVELESITQSESFQTQTNVTYSHSCWYYCQIFKFMFLMKNLLSQWN